MRTFTAFVPQGARIGTAQGLGATSLSKAGRPVRCVRALILPTRPGTSPPRPGPLGTLLFGGPLDAPSPIEPDALILATWTGLLALLLGHVTYSLRPWTLFRYEPAAHGRVRVMQKAIEPASCHAHL